MGIGIFNAGQLLKKLNLCRLVQACAACGLPAWSGLFSQLDVAQLERALEGHAIDGRKSCRCLISPQWDITLEPPR